MSDADATTRDGLPISGDHAGCDCGCSDEASGARTDPPATAADDHVGGGCCGGHRH